MNRQLAVMGRVAVLTVFVAGTTFGAPAHVRAQTAAAPPFFAGEVFNDAVPPALGLAPMDNVVLLFFGSLDQASVPAPSAFVVTVNGTAQTPSSVTIPYVMYDGSSLGSGVSGVRLGLTTPIQPGQTGTVTYTAPSLSPLLVGVDQVPDFADMPLQLWGPQDIGPFSVFAGIADEYRGRNHITALLTQQPTTGALPNPSDFSVTQTTSAGVTTTFSPTALSVVFPGFGFGFLDLLLPVTLAWDDTVTLSYTPGTSLLWNLAGTESAPAYSGSVLVNLGQTPLSATAAGTGVAVVPDTAPGVPSPVSVTYGDVTQAGSTYLTVTSTAPTLPAGYQIGNPPLYYDIQTTASYSGSITVCISYAGMTTPPTSLLHYQNGAWVNIETSIDTSTTTICGSTTSLSPFALATETVPLLTVPSSIATTATGPTGALVSYAASATDVNGAPIAPTCAPASGSTFPVGTTTVTCTATGAAGGTASASFPVTVGYGFGGFFQPLNDPISTTNPMSVYRGGSTIAVKFALTYADGTRILDSDAAAIATACGATVALAQTAASAPSVDEVVTSAAANAGTCFRYDTTAHQFIFNLGTSGLATNTQYELRARVVGPDGTLLATHGLAIGLR